MIQLADIRKIFEKCTSSKAGDIITARTIYDYMVSPFIVHCNKFAPEEKKDPITDYMRLLFEQGNAHEENVIEENYPDIEKVKYETLEEGFMLLLEGMAGGVSTLCGVPVFYLPEGLRGIFDVLERRDTAPSTFGDYHYVVKEIKLAKNIQRHHIMQAAFYNYALGKVQGYTPGSFFMVNRDFEEFEIPYNEAVLLNILQDIREILNGKEVSPTHGACQWPWATYNDEEAIRRRDISLVSGVGPSFKEKLADTGIRTVDELANAAIDSLTCIKGIGEKTAMKFLNGSKALQTGKPIQIGHVEFPRRDTEIFLDLEGTGEQVADEELVAIDYLIGALVRKDGKEEYVPFVAHGLDKEKEMFEGFISWLQGQKDFIIYHWHSYERTHLNRLAERHDLSDELKSMLFDNMRDLYKDAISCFAYPTYGNGLKEVAKFMGYEWRHEDVNAMESIAIYFQYTNDPENNADQLQKVIDYNEDDCQATKVVRDWLEENLKGKII